MEGLEELSGWGALEGSVKMKAWEVWEVLEDGEDWGDREEWKDWVDLETSESSKGAPNHRRHTELAPSWVIYRGWGCPKYPKYKKHQEEKQCSPQHQRNY